MHCKIIVFLIKTSSRNAIRKKMWTTSCLQRKLQNVLSNVTYSPNHRQAGAPMINIQSALRTAPDSWKNISLAVLFGSNDSSYTVSTQSDMCVYITFFTM
jgi:hypothetical protein